MVLWSVPAFLLAETSLGPRASGEVGGRPLLTDPHAKQIGRLRDFRAEPASAALKE